jgi:hypothetical protein
MASRESLLNAGRAQNHLIPMNNDARGLHATAADSRRATVRLTVTVRVRSLPNVFRS